MSAFFDRVEQLLIEDEDLRLKPYRCSAGKLTIGVGRNLEDTGISREEAMYLLRNDVRRAVEQAARIFPRWDFYTDNRRQALTCMLFNMGLGNAFRGFLSFRNAVRLTREEKWTEAAAAFLDSKWARQDVGDGPGGRFDRAERLAQMLVDG